MMSTKRGRFGSPKNRRPLVGDLAKLAQPSGVADPRTLGGSMVGPGGSRERNAVLIDMADVVLVDNVDVCVVEAVLAGVVTGKPIFMTLGGRVNKTTRHVQAGFVFGSDGSAAIVTQLLSLADRAGVEALTDLTNRFADLAKDGDVDLAFLRAALDNAMAAGGES